jgi:hypothetical protein
MEAGPAGNLPDHIANHPARNTYYGSCRCCWDWLGMFLPLQKTQERFHGCLLLFFFTGLAIIIYLNQTPLQPRERDYTYAGSFLAFSIWIGMGVLALIEWLQKKIS